MNLNELLDEFIKSQNIMEEDLTKKDIFKLLFLFIKKNIYEELMKKELEHFLKLENEEKGDNEEKNYKNGIRTRGLKTTEGYIEELRVPRARKGFYPHILEKHKRKEDIFNDLIRSLYSCNASTRDIERIIKNIYGCKYSSGTISNITNTIMEEVKAFKNRKLERDYFVIYIDSIFASIRRDTVEKECISFVLGVNTEGYREVLGFYINPTESANFWEEIFLDLKKRGLERVFLFVTDGLSGIEEIIKNNFPKAKIQRCILHITKNISSKCRAKDRAELLNDFM